jgi:outer membrane protein with beta-barrel domain
MTRRPRDRFLLAALLAAVSSEVRAQEPGTRLGFELGYSQARFVSSGTSGDSRDGSLIAGFLERRIAGPLSGQAELMFSRRGGALSAAGPGGGVAGTAQLIYVEIPVLARLTLPVGRLRPVLLGGGSFAVSVGCELQVAGPDNLEQQPCDGPAATVPLTGSDLSAVFGGGIDYGWKGSHLRLEVRRTIGLRDVAAGQDIRNRVWAVLLGITF